MPKWLCNYLLNHPELLGKIILHSSVSVVGNTFEGRSENTSTEIQSIIVEVYRTACNRHSVNILNYLDLDS